MRARVTMTGEMGLRLSSGDDVKLTRVELRSAGTFDAPEAPLRLSIEAPHDELRKLHVVSPSIAAILELDPDADGEGQLVLVARPEQIAALREAAQSMPELAGDAILQNAAWMTRLFTLEGYDAESIGTIERWTE